MFLQPGVDVVIPEGKCINGIIGDGVKTIPVSDCSPAKAIRLAHPETNGACVEMQTPEETAKLCEIAEGITSVFECLEIIKTQPAAQIDGNLVDLKKCTPDGRPIVFYAETNEVTGEVTFTTYVLEGGTLIPYLGGECVECNKQYNFTQTYIGDESSPYCGLPVFECAGELFVLFDGEYIQLPEDTNMLEVSTTNPSASALTCETLDVQISITDPLEGVATDLVALAIAEGFTFPTFGAPLAEDALAITGCSTGVAADLYGGKTGDTIKDTEGVSANTPFNFTDVDCLPVDLNICFRKCLSAADIKALEGEKG